MSVHHSPRGLGTGGSGGGSQPDLRSLSHTDMDPSREDLFITQRKRKQPDEDSNYRQDLNLFRAEFMSFLNEFSKSQKENTSQIRQDLQEIKEEIKNLRVTTNILSQNYINLSEEVSTLKTESSETNKKIEILEKQLLVMKNSDSYNSQIDNNEQTYSQSTKSPVACDQDLLLELQDRCERLKNVILEGIPEINNKDRQARQKHDLDSTMNKLITIYKDCPNPIKLIRLGKYKPEEQTNGRLIKVCFTTSDPVRILLRNRSKLSDNVRLFSDQTPSQKLYLKRLKNELSDREKAGESNLTIKYIKGIPKIIKSQSKN